VLGEFPRQATDSLISLDWVEQAEQRGFDTDSQPELSDQARPAPGIILGLDVARYGDCESVLAERCGDELVQMTAWQGHDLMHTVGIVVARCGAGRVQEVIIDTVGVGAGVYDRLLEMVNEGSTPGLSGVVITPFSSGERAQDDQFDAVRDEAFWSLRERYRDGKIAHRDKWETLTGQLTKLRYSYSSRGKVKIETKDELRKRGQKSPDWADAVLLAFWVVRNRFLPGASSHQRNEPRLF
jgi:hypothetical protein